MDLEEAFYGNAIALNEEHDCEAHTFRLRVTFAPETINAGTPGIIAGLLRVLAIHLDGYCAVRGAKDEDFREPGMVFYFTSISSRAAFPVLCGKYLRERVARALTFMEE